MTPKPLVLFLKGLNDQRIVQVLEIKPDRNLRYAIDGSANLSNSLKSEAFDKQQIILDPHRMNEFKLGRKPSLIFNEIADPDSHRLTLGLVQRLAAQYGEGVPVLNRAERVYGTRRESVAAKLQGIPGLIMPQTIRIQPASPAGILAAIESAGLRFPVIIRPAGAHTGRGTVLLADAEQVLKHYLHALDGRDYYLTQYVDYAEDGIYRKLRIIMIDGEPILRHVRYSSDWIIHRKSYQAFIERHPQYLEIEKALLARSETELLPQLKSRLSEIQARIGLDYFGIDCALSRDNQLLIFEVNACMNVMSSMDARDHYQLPLARIKAALLRLLEARCR